MMTPNQLELITAAVDGELSATEYPALRDLLAKSSEARTLHAKLLADSRRLRALPQIVPPANLQAKILAAIAASPASQPSKQPLAEPAKTPVRSLPRRSVPSWLPIASAASVLIGIAACSFAFFNAQNPTRPVAKSQWSDSLPASNDSVASVPSPTAREVEHPDPNAIAHTNVMPVPVPEPRVVPPVGIAIAPEPRTLTPDLIGSPLLPKLPPFERIEVRVPFLRPVADLGRDDLRDDLITELGRESAIKLDVFVRDTARGAEVFQNAARAAGITLFVDAATLDKLKKRQVQSVVIYTESLTAPELATLFAKLSAEDAKFSPRVCDSLHATTITRSEELDLKAILGVDVGLFKRPATSNNSAGQGSANNADPKPVSAGTIDSVVKSVTTPQTKVGEKPAILLTWQTANSGIARTNPANSAELKQYLAKRTDRKPTAIPAIIVIRPAG
jgi:negative regulator of sigma E activity